MKILNRYWPLLQGEPDLKEVITQHPSITYRQGNNLREMIVHSHYGSGKKPGTWLKSPTMFFYYCRSLLAKSRLRSRCLLLPNCVSFSLTIVSRCCTASLLLLWSYFCFGNLSTVALIVIHIFCFSLGLFKSLLTVYTLYIYTLT